MVLGGLRDCWLAKGSWAGFPRSPAELQVLLKTGVRLGCGWLSFYFLPFFSPSSLFPPSSHFYVPSPLLHPAWVPGSSIALRTQYSAHPIPSHPRSGPSSPTAFCHTASLSLLMLCSSISNFFQIICSFQPLSFRVCCSLCLEDALVDSYSSAGPSCNFLQEALPAVLQVHLRLPC